MRKNTERTQNPTKTDGIHKSSGNNVPRWSQGHRNRLLFLITMALLGAVVLLGVVVYSGFIQPAAKGQLSAKGELDPLSAQEEAFSQAQLAQIVVNEQARAATAQRQVILTTDRYRHPKGKSTTKETNQQKARQAEGYIYNYDMDTLQRVLIDVTTGETVIVESVQDVQLPLVEAEKERALALIRNDQHAWTQVQREYRRITDSELVDLAQVETKILIFQANAMPNRVNEASSRCGRHRCAQVLLFTHDRFVFEMDLIVDLSSQSVAQLYWEGK